MASTHGHGNPHWTSDEVILALDLYFDCKDKIPGPEDFRVQALSEQLRAFPHHSEAARRDSFRNPAGVAFKLQNLRQVATGKGMANVSRTDREVWEEFGKDQARTKQLADLLRAGIAVVEDNPPEPHTEYVFTEGRLVTETHLRRERNPRLRELLLEERRKSGDLSCEMCELTPPAEAQEIYEAVFEAHHLVPLAAGQERQTRVKDMALLCANCHRIIHRAIAISKRWISIEEARAKIE